MTNEPKVLDPATEDALRRVRALEDLVARLRERQERCELFFERSVMGILLGDGQGHILDANPRALSLLGYDLDELRAMSIRQLVHPDDQKAMPVEVGPAAARGGRPCSIERRYRRKDGSWQPLQVDFSPLAEGGRLVQIMLQDITARKAAEEAKNAALAQARAASQAKSTFLANMSHEIRTPLNGVMGMLQLLMADPHTPEQEECLTSAMDAAGALLRILTDVLDIARLDAGNMALADEEFNLADVLDPVIASFTHEAVVKGLKLACRVDREAPSRLRGDPARVRQILYNLTGNAIKYTSFGQVGLAVAPLPGPNAPDKACLEFAITDTGCGIATDKQRLVFDAFAQADPSLSRAHGGLGLGLAIARALTERMDGRILLTSQEGSGTEVRVRLAFTRPAEPVAACPSPPCPAWLADGCWSSRTKPSTG